MDSITPLYTKAVKRLRVFAGPNGAGKSSTRGGISELGIRLGKWINADDLLGLFTSGDGTMSLSRYLVSPDVEHFRSFYMKHSLVAARNLPWCFTTGGCAGEIGIDKKILADTNISAYVMSIMADYLRTSLVKAGESFAFETVFSHPSKLDFMRSAKAAGYRIYLYFVCVEPPELCVSRVAIRVAQSGHNVPKEKILPDISAACLYLQRPLRFLTESTSSITPKRQRQSLSTRLCVLKSRTETACFR